MLDPSQSRHHRVLRGGSWFVNQLYARGANRNRDDPSGGAGFKPAPTGAKMRCDPEKHNRQSIRLKGYDYRRAAAYFFTCCTTNRECLFGEIADGCMRLNPFGNIVQACWEDLPQHYPHVELDVFAIMPNHVHGIIVLGDTDVSANVGAGLKPAPTKRHGLAEIIRAFKTFSARRINELREARGTSLWQRNYYEHVIRSADEWQHIREYILDNPARWEMDEENPKSPKNRSGRFW